MHEVLRGLLFAISYVVFAAVGVSANLAIIIVLLRRRCGLSGCMTYYLMSMAATDLLVLVTIVILNRITGIYFPFTFLSITPICSFRAAVNFAVIDSSVWLTVAFTFDRFIAICWQKLKIKYCTEKMAAWVIGIVSALSCGKNIATYFMYEPVYIINNRPWFCAVKATYYISLAWAAYDWIRSILTPCLPFILILLLNALTIRHILAAIASRRRLRSQRTGENQGDPEIEKRRESIVFLFAISGSFIPLYLVFVVMILYVRIANVTYSSGSDASDPIFILQQCGYMLQLLSSCINPFIYAGTQ
ncbi:probable G-protein coupled receptor 139, partial [Chiloscyllium plagiosum]|uniref:probable G-protein coupled receptor 139 n=1 Tax=Chiloscyllium plagiosum TaxID=36176 RepID=UPI001CB7DB37